MRTKLDLISIILGVIISIIVLSNFIGPKRNFEDASVFGAQVTSSFPRIGEYRIHCEDSRNADDCLQGLKHRGSKRSVLWLGNSQLHSINQWKEGDINSTLHLHNMLIEKGLDLITFSQPNASFQEQYVIFEYLKEKMPIKVLLLPAVFDDTREDGLRNEVAEWAGEKGVQAELSKTTVGNKLIKMGEAHNVPKESKGMNTPSLSIQDSLEASIDGWLNENSLLWATRPEVRGWIFFDFLYQLRNTVFGINPSTKRKAIKVRYKNNLEAFEAILFDAKKMGISVIVYIAPIRNDVEIPYVESEYASFKNDVKLISVKYGAIFSDEENLVPPSMWGSKDGTTLGGKKQELDFMHFQAGGHFLLARKLNELIESNGRK